MKVYMNRYLNIILIIIAIMPIFLYLFIQPIQDQNDNFALVESDKEKMLKYSYDILNDYFTNNSSSKNELGKLSNDIPYNILFITLLKNGKVRACQSGSTPLNESNRIFLDINEAIVECINDERFGGKIQKDERSQIDILFTFLYDIHWLSNTSIIFLQNNIELGIHALELSVNNTPIIFKESVPISNNYDLEYTLDRLCKKANLNENCYLSDDVDLFRYETYSFKGNKNLEIIDLYRYNILINHDEITNDMILDRIHLGYSWFLKNIDEDTKTLKYQYFPSDDYYAKENNDVRQLASLWSLTSLNQFFKDNESDIIIKNFLDYYVKYLNASSNFSYLTINNESKLANNAFLLMSVLNTPNYENKSNYTKQLANGILSLQQENGSFQTYFFSDKNTGIDYYPGEAMLSLMKSYIHSKNNTYLESVKKGFDFYKLYWRNNKNTAFIPWHTQTYALLFEITKDQEVAEFIFEMNDWIIDNFQIMDSNYLDEIGGFPYYYPTFSTSVFLEGINDAYLVALQQNDTDHITKYENAIINGTRFILQTQFTEENSFYVENKTRTIGGFKTSLTDNSIRIDNVQHAVLSLMKTYDLKIFE